VIGSRVRIPADALGTDAELELTGTIESMTNEAVLVRLDQGEKVWARFDQVERIPDITIEEGEK
jgi:hypothetical protein